MTDASTRSDGNDRQNQVVAGTEASINVMSWGEQGEGQGKGGGRGEGEGGEGGEGEGKGEGWE